MTAECRVQLSRRQQVVAQDWLADGGLGRACSAELQAADCSSHTGLGQLLGCLEDWRLGAGAGRLGGECEAELREVKRELLGDSLAAQPELAQACRQEVVDLCPDSAAHPDQTVHCLMAAAVEQSQKRLQVAALPASTALHSPLQGEQLDHRLGEACDAALTALLRETQVCVLLRLLPTIPESLAVSYCGGDDGLEGGPRTGGRLRGGGGGCLPAPGLLPLCLHF